MTRGFSLIFLVLAFANLFGQSGWPERIKKASQGEPSESIELLKVLEKELLPSSDDYNIGMTQYLIANRYFKVQDYTQAIIYCKEAIKSFVEAGYYKYRLRRSALIVGESFREIGMIDSSLYYYQMVSTLPAQGKFAYDVHSRSLRKLSFLYKEYYNTIETPVNLFEELFVSDIYDSLSVLEQANSHMEMSTLFSIYNEEKHWDAAERHVNIADSIFYARAKGKSNVVTTYYCVNQRSVILEKRGLYNDSFRNLLAFYNAYQNNEDVGKLGMNYVKLLINLCATGLQARYYTEAIVFGKMAQKHYLSLGQQNTHLLYLIYDNLGSAYIGGQKIDSALAYLDRGIDLFDVHRENQTINLNKKQLCNLLYDKARAFKSRFQQSENVLDLNSSLKCLQSLDSIVPFYLHDQELEGGLINLRVGMSKYYELGVDLAYLTSDEQLFAHFADMNRGLLLLDKWSKKNYSNDTLAVALEQKLQSLREEELKLEYANQSKNEKESDVLLTRNKEQQLHIQARLKGLQIFNATKVWGIDEIREGLTQEVVYYHYGTEDIYGLHITPSSADLLNLGPIAEIENLLSEYIHSLRLRDEEAVTGNRVFKALIQPFKFKSSKVKIIADGVLNYLPFEALRLDNGKFLSENFSISYSVSLSLDRQWYAENGLRSSQFNIVSPIYDSLGMEDYFVSLTKGGGDYEFRYLHYSDNEVTELSSRYNSSLLKDTNISKTRFLSSLESSDIFHFTGHAVLDPEEYGFSFLALGDNENDIDNVVTMSEINQANTNAQLVMLNACNTGNGKILKGEGVFSLARAFFRAGAKSVVNALWEIDDESSMLITLSFYKYLKKGHTKSSALRQAKLDYLNSDIPEYKKHPYYWAGLVLVGNDAPLKFASDYSMTHYGLLLGTAALIGLFYFGMRNRTLLFN